MPTTLPRSKLITPPVPLQRNAETDTPVNNRKTEQEPYFILPTSDPFTFNVPDGLLHDHFMPWAHPFTSVITGPTGSGKSVFVRRFIDNIQHMTLPQPDRIWWSYDVQQPLYSGMNNVEFIRGLPDIESLNPEEKHLIVIDDQMDNITQAIADLFTKYSHHRSISIMLIVQNLFNKNKHHRTISLNTHYMVVFKNPRDTSQIMTLGQQMFPGRSKYFLESYEAAVRKPHGYMLIDMRQDTPEILRLRTNIFPGEEQIAMVDM